MTKVQVSEHVWVNISRRCLCDNCIADICFKKDRDNIEQCDLYKSQYIAFKKCGQCGEIYELFSNYKALNYELCPACNEKIKMPPESGQEVSVEAQAKGPVESHC